MLQTSSCTIPSTPSQGYNQLTQALVCFLTMFYFFSTVLLKVSFNMFNWEMDFFSAEVNTQSKAIEAVAKVTTTTMLRFPKGKKIIRQPRS